MLGMASMLQAWLLLSCLSLQAYAQSLPTTVLLQLGAVPASLEASIVASSTDSGIDKDGVVTYELNCASAVSPENDACRALNLYPAHAYHTQGSIWGGTITVRADEVTTTWRCELGDCRKVYLPVSGHDLF
ncbi:hypothetical protein B0O99DRAFT_246808 [Bisporella sp. PMI_857]|nr:hypothetical protein B0O99DRAFT_246808 [Bisporella sp. PMI_857]